MARFSDVRCVNCYINNLMWLVLLETLFVAFFVVPSAAQSDSNVSKSVDAFVRRKMAAEQIPGVQIAILQNGKLIKLGSYGISNVELNSAVTDETMFEIASNSKQFTAGGILLLDEEGKLKIDDRITKYLNGLPEEYSRITIRQLLNHTSGVKDYIEEFDLNRRLDYTNKELIERIGQNKLNFPPGEGSRYSTTGYLLLGIIIENITGKPYGEFLRDRIFLPLGMRHTRTIDLNEVIPRRATGYVLQKGKLAHGKYVAQTLRSSADIGMMTTASDVAKWAATLETTKLFKTATLDTMFAPGKLGNGDLALNDWNGYFGAGWFIDDYLGNREIDHGGTLITGFHCNISRFVDKKLTVVVLTNRLRSDPSMLGYSIAGMYDPDLRPPHMMAAKKDGDPDRTARLQGILTKGANESPERSSFTDGYFSRFVSDQGPKADLKEALATTTRLSFIECKDVSWRNVERIHSKVANICVFKTKGTQIDHYISVYLDAGERVADLWIYSSGK